MKVSEADQLEEAVCEIANSLLDGKSHIKLLEAGCGSASHVRFRASVHAVGIDISMEQLEKNTIMQEKILGDIQKYSLPKEEFDVAVCWMVLEHLSRPKDALLNLFGAVKPGGLLILAIPNLLSFKGLATKITPFWFHKLYYRLMKYKSRPFPTYLRLAILPNEVMRFAEDNGFSAVFFRLLEGSGTKRIRSSFWFVDLAFKIANSVMQIISPGELQSLFLDNCAMILRKCGENS